jgi:hypothetical protein
VSGAWIIFRKNFRKELVITLWYETNYFRANEKSIDELSEKISEIGSAEITVPPPSGNEEEDGLIGAPFLCCPISFQWNG